MSPNLPQTAAKRGKIAPAKFAHSVLRTAPEGVASLVAWWKTVLEAEAAFENPVVCFMTYDDEHHRIAVVGIPGVVDKTLNARGVDHIAFTYASFPDLVHTYERLKEHGIVPSTTIHHGPTLSLYYLDPDRNQVELQIDVFDDAEAEAAFMESGHFASNPIGTLFDMDALCTRFHAGEPVAELIAPILGALPGPGAFGEH